MLLETSVISGSNGDRGRGQPRGAHEINNAVRQREAVLRRHPPLRGRAFSRAVRVSTGR